MSEARYRICSLITELRVGGAQNVLADVVLGLPRERYEQTVVCLFGAGETAHRLRDAGIEVVDLDMHGKADVRVVWRLWRLLRRLRPQLLHTHMFHANVLGRVLGRLAGVPYVVSTEHTMGQEGQVRRFFDRLTSPLADRVVAVSESVGAFIREKIGISPQRVVVIPNGIDLDRCRTSLTPAEARARLGLPTDVPVIGTIGTLRPVKGTDMLLRAFALLQGDFPTARLLIVGDGVEREPLHALAIELGISARTTFTGNRNDVGDLLVAMTVFCLPSHWEGLPLAALEAMCAGLPLVATQVGGTPEVVRDGETGRLVPPADPGALAQATAEFLRDPARSAIVGATGRRWVEENYARSRMVERNEALYEELLQRGEKG